MRTYSFITTVLQNNMKLLHKKQHEDAVGKCYENGKATQFNSNSCGAQDKSDNIGRFCSGRHGNVPFEIAISEFKKKKYISQRPRCFYGQKRRVEALARLR